MKRNYNPVIYIKPGKNVYNYNRSDIKALKRIVTFFQGC